MKSKIYSILLAFISLSFALEAMEKAQLAEMLEDTINQMEEGNASSGKKEKGKEKIKRKPRKRKEASSSEDEYSSDEKPSRSRRPKNYAEGLFQSTGERFVSGFAQTVSGGVGNAADKLKETADSFYLAGNAIAAAFDFAGPTVGNFLKENLQKTIDNELEQQRVNNEAKARAEEQIYVNRANAKQARYDSRQQRKGLTDGMIGASKAWINFIRKKPYIIVGIAGGIAASYFAAKHGMKVAFNEIERLIGIPRLAQDTSILTFREKIAKSLGLYREEILKKEELIFNDDFKKRIFSLIDSISHSVNNGTLLRHCLFYGPPGTGKTLAAKTIAKNSGVDYIYFAASGLLKLVQKGAVNEALNQLTELFEFGKRSSKRLMMIIDEAEVLFEDRNSETVNAQMRLILDLLLSYMGTESPDYFVVAITNLPEKLDGAFVNRCAERIKFPTPNYEEIRRLLELYVNKLMVKRPVIKSTLYQRWFGRKLGRQITIEPSALNKEMLDGIATKLNGFVGRDINNLVISLLADTYATKDFKLTKGLVNEIIDRKIAEKIEADNKFQTK